MKRLTRLWRKLRSKLPSFTRKGKVIRNLVFILLTAVLFWWAMGAPALTPQWRYRRAERRNMLCDTEIIAVLEPHWINWEEPAELVVAENEAMYILCLTNEPFYSMGVQIYEKQGAVTLTGVPESFSVNFFRQAIPFVVLTELPAVRAEVELILPPELSWRWADRPGREPFVGAVYRGEDYNEDGVFTFSFPQELTEMDPQGNDLTDQLVMEWDALYIFSQILLGVKQDDYGCSVTAHIHLWNADDVLIYDDTLIYDIGVMEDEN